MGALGRVSSVSLPSKEPIVPFQVWDWAECPGSSLTSQRGWGGTAAPVWVSLLSSAQLEVRLESVLSVQHTDERVQSLPCTGLGQVGAHTSDSLANNL